MWKAFEKFAMKQFDKTEIGDALDHPNEKTSELQYPPRQRGHPPILQLKSHFLHVYSLMTVHSNLIMNISAKSYCFSLAISLFRIFRFAFIMKL